MRSLKIFSIILLLAVLHSGIQSCKNNSGKKAVQPEIPTGEINVNDFEQKLNTSVNAQILDVRTPEEFEEGHLLNALNIDWNGDDFEMKIKALDKTRPTFVYCHSGNRSHKAGQVLKTNGYTEVYEMKGGIAAWEKEGKTIIKEEKKADETIELKNLSMDSYNKIVTSDKLVLTDFNAPWCGPCKRMAPMLEELAKEQKEKLTLISINSDENPKLTGDLQVANLPTLFLYKKGKQVWKHVGYLDKIELMVAIESVRN